MSKNDKASTNVVVAFHTPSESAFEFCSLELEKVMNELFGESCKRAELPIESMDEIIYSIEKPLNTDPETLERFFKTLKRLLTRTVSYNPHFTQLPDVFTEGRI